MEWMSCLLLMIDGAASTQSTQLIGFAEFTSFQKELMKPFDEPRHWLANSMNSYEIEFIEFINVSINSFRNTFMRWLGQQREKQAILLRRKRRASRALKPFAPSETFNSINSIPFISAMQVAVE